MPFERPDLLCKYLLNESRKFKASRSSKCSDAIFHCVHSNSLSLPTDFFPETGDFARWITFTSFQNDWARNISFNFPAFLVQFLRNRLSYSISTLGKINSYHCNHGSCTSISPGNEIMSPSWRWIVTMINRPEIIDQPPHRTTPLNRCDRINFHCRLTIIVSIDLTSDE